MVPKLTRPQRSMVVLVGRFRFFVSSANNHDRNSVPDTCTRLPWCQACSCKWTYQTEQKCAQRMVPKMPRPQRSMVVLVGRFQFSGSSATLMIGIAGPTHAHVSHDVRHVHANGRIKRSKGALSAWYQSCRARSALWLSWLDGFGFPCLAHALMIGIACSTHALVLNDV